MYHKMKPLNVKDDKLRKLIYLNYNKELIIIFESICHPNIFKWFIFNTLTPSPPLKQTKKKKLI